jgi:hypothetical protein
MKSIIIRQDDKIIIHIKRTKKGAVAKVLSDIKNLKIKIILKDKSIINL